jgi:glutamine---fructose-6-phosphate transaminase (isomerizing)
MCGIYAYAGVVDATKIVFSGLKKLEYRGYDSWGIAALMDHKLQFEKHTGKINQASLSLPPSSLALGHTRWATHGGVTQKNAHPHPDCHRQLAIVHNGIIDNYQPLKADLIRLGHRFLSETDSEVIAHLTESYLDKGLDFPTAVRHTFNQLSGLNTIAVLHQSGQIVAFKKGSPLVAGTAANAVFLSSDIPALLAHTSRLAIIDEGQGVVITPSRQLQLIDSKTGQVSTPVYEKITMTVETADQGSFDHFLVKEIHDQPEVLRRLAAGPKKPILEAAELIRHSFGTYISACGTAANAGLAATYMFSKLAATHVNSVVASEFPYFSHFLAPQSLLIAASQSGETMDTLEAVRAAKSQDASVLALVNVPGSTLTRLADQTIFLTAGSEQAVISTKAYLAKLGVFFLLAHALEGDAAAGARLLSKTAQAIDELLAGSLDRSIRRLASSLAREEHLYLIGRGLNYATALEGALKIKEASYIHAEGFAGGELKHGVIALIEKNTPCLVIVAEDETKADTLSNAMELKARGAFIIGLGSQPEAVFDVFIPVPDLGSASPLVNIVPLQLLAYHLALVKGCDPDKPRNLAKSVTVK